MLAALSKDRRTCAWTVRNRLIKKVYVETYGMCGHVERIYRVVRLGGLAPARPPARPIMGHSVGVGVQGPCFLELA